MLTDTIAPDTVAEPQDFNANPAPTLNDLTAQERLLVELYRLGKINLVGEDLVDPMDRKPGFDTIWMARREFWRVMDEQNCESPETLLAHENLALKIVYGLVDRWYVPRRHLFNVQDGSDHNLLEDMRRILIDAFTDKENRIFIEQLIFLQDGKPASTDPVVDYKSVGR